MPSFESVEHCHARLHPHCSPSPRESRSHPAVPCHVPRPEPTDPHGDPPTISRSTPVTATCHDCLIVTLHPAANDGDLSTAVTCPHDHVPRLHVESIDIKPFQRGRITQDCDTTLPSAQCPGRQPGRSEQQRLPRSNDSDSAALAALQSP